MGVKRKRSLKDYSNAPTIIKTLVRMTIPSLTLEDFKCTIIGLGVIESYTGIHHYPRNLSINTILLQ